MRRFISMLLALSLFVLACCTGCNPRSGNSTDMTETNAITEDPDTEQTTQEGETENMNDPVKTVVEVYDLRVGNISEPLGVPADISPAFSWKFTENRRNVTQKAYRITVGTSEGSSDVYEGEWVESNEQYAVTSEGLVTLPQTRYYWQVEVKDDQDNVGKASSYFETALAASSWNQAMWIGGKAIRRLRNEITLKDTVKNARAYVTGLGYYEFYINGEKVGDRVLDPAFGNYYEIVRYSTFDVTKMLRQGENALGILLASGLYGAKFSNQMKGILYLSVEYSNGETEIFVTDTGWKMTQSGAYTREDAYSGEDYDARLEDGWLSCGYDDSTWEAGKQVDTVIPVEQGIITTDCSDMQLAPEALSVDDYVIEAEIEIINSCGGIVFRAKDTNNCYMWQFTGSKLRAHMWINGAVSVTEQLYGVNPYNAEGRIPIRIEVNGSIIRTTVNGKQLPDITDTANTTGTVGFRAAASSKESARIHGYTVKSLAGDVIYSYEDVDGWNITDITMESYLDPMRVVSSTAPLSVKQLPNGNYIVDTGVNATGWLRLQNLNGASGTKITIRYGELINADGTLDAETVRHNYVSSYTLSGKGNEGWSQKFCYTSFRYAEISGYDGLTADNILVERVHSDITSSGSFESSNELLSKIQSAYLNSQLSNLMSVPVDCPHREKAPWLGDAHVTSEATLYNFDSVNLYTRWFRDWESAQEENGFINLQSPDPQNATGSSTFYGVGDVVWTVALMVIPWDVYQFTGDLTVLADNYDMIKRHADWLMTHEPEPNMGSTLHWDWVGPDKDAMSSQCVGTAYYYHAIDLTSQIALALGNTVDAEVFAKKAEAIKNTFNQKFFRGKFYDTNTQTVHGIALEFGLVPEESIDSVIQRLERVITVTKDGHMSVGVAGVRALPAALTKYERPDLTYLMMTQTTYPSLGFMIESGATSLWEYWEHPDWSGIGMAATVGRAWRSQNHCFLGGGFSAWLYEDLLGITASEAGFDRIQIKPQIVGDLRYAKGGVETIHGKVTVDWALDGADNLTMKVTVPTNTVADVYVPIRGDAKNVTVTDGEDTWFIGGEPNTDRYVETTKTHVVFRVGSGDYCFTMTGEGTYPFAQSPEAE